MDGLIAIGIFVGVWWALARYWRLKGKGKLVRHLGASSGATLAMLIFVVIVAPKQENAQQPQADTAASSTGTPSVPSPNMEPVASVASATNAPSEAKEPVATLDLTPDQYVKRFNGFMAEMKMPFRIKARIEKGAVNDTFSSMLNDHLGITGSVDKESGKVIGVMFIGSGNNTTKSGLDIVQVSIAVMAAGVPNGTLKNTAPVVMELFRSFKDGQKESSSRIFNNAKLSYMRSSIVGNMFSVAAM